MSFIMKVGPVFNNLIAIKIRYELQKNSEDNMDYDSHSRALIFFYYHHVDSFQGYKMDDLLTSYISLMLTSMNKQKSVKKWGRRGENQILMHSKDRYMQ